MANHPKAYIRYITAFSVTTFIILAATIGTSIIMNKLNIVHDGYSVLYRYQLDKIEHMKNPDVILIGDSSLGNSVNAATLSKLINKNVYSLALTGTFGYAGSFNMLSRALKTGKPELVVLCQTLDMMTRTVGHGAYAMTMENPSFSELIRLRGIYMDIDIFKKLFDTLTDKDTRTTINPARDYFPQSEPIRDELNHLNKIDGLDAASIIEEKVYYLKKIIALCKTNGIPFVYFHGPLYEPMLKKSNPYKNKVNEILEGSGTIVEKATPVPIPLNKVGDSVDHVAPEYKVEYTQKMADLIVKYIPSHHLTANKQVKFHDDKAQPTIQ
ncbi:hypothetical protein [Maridesulfovibrio sp.]|uniref:hypothetical protein n=1 Tax=Maridesulfovibrio sp. TaxID=2795000 RepID=UPI0029CA8EEE|nr:hypothetical protein [Maridesulfovibrio sp.]